MRHDSIRDTPAYFLRGAKCKDVRIEPSLMPVNASLFKRRSNTQDEARLDISAVGVYAPFEKTYFDVRVTHPNCKTNIFKPLAQVFAEHDKAKAGTYMNDAVSSWECGGCPVGSRDRLMGVSCCCVCDRVASVGVFYCRLCIRC